MRWRPLTWFLVSLLLFAGALVCWQWSSRLGDSSPPGAASAPARPQPKAADTTPRAWRDREAFQLLSGAAAHPAPAALRLANASLSVAEWQRRSTAVLLENALIDTAAAAPAVPGHLQARAGHGTFIVQAHGHIDEAFRAVLRGAGAGIVAYLPNNAYLVRLADDAARRLQGLPNVQAILPYEPYYKLKTDLLRLALNQTDLPLGERLSVALFADARDTTLAALQALGAKVLAEERSPFGPVVTVAPPVDGLVAIASLPGVQVVETLPGRMPANDRSRARMGVAADTVVPDNWLGLTGTNVLVNANDSGVDATHPDLTGRMFALFADDLLDPNGHGTHVIGTIAGNGAMSTTVSNASGSEMPGVDGQFRGAAPGAKVFVLPVFHENRPGRSAGGPFFSDSTLQEMVAQTNAFISNNSWNYGGNNGYDLAAARYDAATRDALPGQPGSQPLLFVFAAGNAGRGNNSGQGGDPNSVRSPGTAKNVITVGAIEQNRDLTNDVISATGVTNQPFQFETDSDDQVAAYSGRGNTAIGGEGESGRFKPDVVAPGSWVVSTRSQQWDEADYLNPTNAFSSVFPDLVALPGEFNNYSIFVPPNAVQMRVDVFPNAASPPPFPDLPIFVRQAGIPTTNTYDFIVTNHLAMPPDGGPNLMSDVGWNYSVANPTTTTVVYDLVTTLVVTNALGNELEVRSNLNNTLGPWYRYESGSSMAAAHVAGTLALMQEFFEQRLGRTNSPALMKALLINGARSLGNIYDFQVHGRQNFQGWGLVNLPTTLPEALANLDVQTAGPVFLADQSPTNALATGQRHVRLLSLTNPARTVPLRVTLVWTDPPGNPAAGVKLVNDLDLVVTNLDTGEVYFGNDIPSGSDFNQTWDTNALPNNDVVNNVENVYLPPLLGTNYAITVVASRVNVNAVTAHPDDTVQDYALVISSGDGELEDALTVTGQSAPDLGQPNVTAPTNTFDTATTPGYTGTLLLGQHVGANTPLLGLTNGMTNQWHFYVLTNTANFTNAAFVTFLPPTLSIPRIGVNEGRLANATRVEADIDLYVSLNPGLTNLDPAVIASADQSRTRGGTEVIVYSNAAPAGVYYIGVKAEDQMAAEYGFLGVFSELPFSENEDGNLILRGFPTPVIVPDGSPDAPGAGLVFAIATQPIPVRRVVVTNTVTHENFGDLVGSLSHNSVFAVLNNKSWPPGDPLPLTYTYLYEDNGEGDPPGTQGTDGPGSLRDFVGEEGAGLWLLQMVDDALTQTGHVGGLSIRLEPQNLDEDGATIRTIPPFRFTYDFIDVPSAATNLTVCVSSNTAPMEIYIRRGAFPTRTEFDKMIIVPAGGGCLTLDRSDLPPLTAGRYYIGVYNPNATAQTVRIVARLELDPAGIVPIVYTGTGEAPLLDDAVTNATVFVTNDARIASVQVGLRIDHPRVSDLAITLISARGTRVLLSENRGWTDPGGFGSTYYVTNVVPASFDGANEPVTNVIDVAMTAGALTIDYEFFGLPDQMTVYYQGALLFDSGMATGPGQVTLNYGPGASTQVTIVMNEFGNPEPGTRWEYTVSSAQEIHNYLTFTENTNLTTTPIKFAAPPFTAVAAPSSQFLSGFEPAAAGDYDSSSPPFDDWTAMTTDPVTVMDDAAVAHTGTKYLSLRSGEIQRALPTISGRGYKVDFAYRSVPYLINVDFSSLPFGNSSSKVGSAATGQRTNDFWNLYNRNGPGGVWKVNGFLTNLRLASQHLTEVGLTVLNAEGAWGNGSLDPMYNAYLYPLPNGPGHVRLAVTNLPAGKYSFYLYSHLGNYQLVSGGVDYGIQMTTDNMTNGRWPLWEEGVHYARFQDVVITNPGQPAEITARPLTDVAMIAGLQIEAAPGTGCQAFVSGVVTNTLIGATNWLTNTLAFVAPADNLSLQFASLGDDSGVLLDTFTLTELPGPQYVLPEESLRALVNENAFGEWTLEIHDTRVGATTVAPVLLSWQLQFVFQTDIPIPGVLPPGESRTNTVPAGQIAYYVVDVPSWASFATNTLIFASAPLNLWFNQDTAPSGTNATDYLLLDQVTSGTVVLSAATTPPLLPGRRYYLGIQNTNAAAADYALRVDFDITPLVNEVPVVGTLDSGGLPRYFSYNVSSNATAVVYALTNLSGDVNLVARQGAPLPTLASYDYGSFNSGSTDELILVFTNSAPVALAPGLWYLGVFNADLAPVTFTIVAAEITEAIPTIITLTNGIPYFNTNTGAAGLVDYYRYVVTHGAARAQFEINGPTDDVTLVARRGFPPLPDLITFDYLSANGHTNDELIVVLTNSVPVPLASGDWFLSAVNVSGGPVSYAIKATDWPITGRPLVITGSGVVTNSFCLTWTSLPGVHYHVDGLTDLNSTNWVTVSPTITATDYSTTWCIGLPSPFHFFRVVEGLALSSYAPAPGITGISRQSGGVLLEWSGPVAATYGVDWSPTLVPPVWTRFTNVLSSTDGQFSFLDDGSQTGGLGATRFYRIEQLP